MRKISFVIVSLMMTSLIMAQTSQPATVPDAPNTGKINVNNSKDRVVVEFMFDNWRWNDDAVKVQPRWFSRGINFFLMYDLPLGESRLSFAPGAGISNQNYFINSALELDTSGISFFNPIRNVIGQDTDFKKYKVSNTFIEVPLEFRYRTTPDKNDRSWKFGIGGRIGYRLTSGTKYKGDDYLNRNHVGTVKNKEKAGYNLANFRYGLTGRVGYGPINIVTFYGLNNMFKENLGPKLNTYSVGIQFNGL